ncbi:MAG: segregation/condensation protein A [Gammaproteobacteria bacterium]|nr:segregation/condensation protein A [Gammaproteobacteria bacterium]
MIQEPAQSSGDTSSPSGAGIVPAAEGVVEDPVATDPIAVVQGEPVTQLPQDLYIPPDALEVILETFEGPLDLLLYLIKRQNLDILNIPIADITAQYMEYIALMETLRFELAAEYLLMAAMLAEIKSRMLLPRVVTGEDDEEDPRAELIRRLQEYEQFKEAALKLESLPRVERELHPTSPVEPPEIDRDVPLPDVTLKELLLALKDITLRSHANEHHHINREALSVRERMTHILGVLQIGEFCEFSTCFMPEEGRLGVVVTFLAILELCKESSIDIVQSAPFAPIYLKARTGSLESGDDAGGANELTHAPGNEEPGGAPSANLEDDTWH